MHTHVYFRIDIYSMWYGRETEYLLWYHPKNEEVSLLGDSGLQNLLLEDPSSLMHGFKKSLELVTKHRLLVPLSKPEIIQRQLYRECIHVPMFRGHFLFELFIRKICSCRCGVWSCKSWLVHHGMVKLQEEIIEIRRRYDRNYRRYIYFWCPIFLGILPCDHIMTAIQIWLQGLGFWMTFFGGILISFVPGSASCVDCGDLSQKVATYICNIRFCLSQGDMVTEHGVLRIGISPVSIGGFFRSLGGLGQPIPQEPPIANPWSWGAAGTAQPNSAQSSCRGGCNFIAGLTAPSLSEFCMSDMISCQWAGFIQLLSASPFGKHIDFRHPIESYWECGLVYGYSCNIPIWTLLLFPAQQGNTCLDGQSSNQGATACFDCGRGNAAEAGDASCTQCRMPWAQG